MKVILDTNVVISGIFFSGPPHHILTAWRDGLFRLILTLEIADEYERVAEELSSQFPEIDIKPILNIIMTNAEFVDPLELPEQICADPDDDKFIACALASRTKIIVSGDKHLLNISGYQNIKGYKTTFFRG